MIRKRKKLILLLIVLLSAVAAFFIVTRKISESHKTEHSIIKTEDYKSYIEKYGTGETLKYSYFTDNSGITKDNLLYIILEVNDKNNSPNQETVRYYIKDKAIIDKIFQALNETDYYVSNMEFRSSKSDDYSSACRIRFISNRESSLDWFGYYTPSEDTFIFSAGLFSSKNLFYSVEAEWIDKYFSYGFFADQKIMQVLTDIVENDIRKITMQEVKEILSSKMPPEIQDFYRYVHTLIERPSLLSAETGCYEYRLDIEGEEGYLLVRNNESGTDDSINLDILSIGLYNKDGTLQELLYEKEGG